MSRPPKGLCHRAILAGEQRADGAPSRWLLRLACGHVVRRSKTDVNGRQVGGRMEFTPATTFCTFCYALGRE